MNRLADEIFSMALSLNRIAAMSYGTPQRFETGSPEAIADCQRRREDAQRIAQHAADANEGKDWNAESLQGEYDTDSEGDENDAN